MSYLQSSLIITNWIANISVHGGEKRFSIANSKVGETKWVKLAEVTFSLVNFLSFRPAMLTITHNSVDGHYWSHWINLVSHTYVFLDYVECLLLLSSIQLAWVESYVLVLPLNFLLLKRYPEGINQDFLCSSNSLCCSLEIERKHNKALRYIFFM